MSVTFDVERLAEWVTARRWFRGKARRRTSAEIADVFDLDGVNVVSLRLGFAEGPAETYVVPIAIEGDRFDDALASESFAVRLRDFVLDDRSVRGRHSTLRGVRLSKSTVDRSALPRIPKVEQTNSSIFFGEALALKVYRVLDDGPNPELELGAFLDGRIATAPHVFGALMVGDSSAIAILQSFVPNRGDAWSATLASIGRMFDGLGPPDVEGARLLGRRTAELHEALLGGTGAAFAPEPLDERERRRLSGATRAAIDRTLDLVAERLDTLDTESRADAARLLNRREALEHLVDRFESSPITGVRTRIHGDFHLGQVLVTLDDDFVIIDFEGEPLRSLAERREKALPLRDVAGMVRSYHYAAHAALKALAPTQQIARAPLAQAWTRTITAAYLEGYGADRVDPRTLALFLVDKCLYEIAYELNNRPNWVSIPIAGAHALLDS